MFNWIDYTIIAIIGVSVVISIARGFVREAFSLATWIGAVWAGIHFHQLASDWLASYIHSNSIRMLAAFLLLFFCTLFMGSLLSFLVVQCIHKTGLSGMDRSLGSVFGLARGCLMVAITLLMASFAFPPVAGKEKSNPLQTSQLAVHFVPLVTWIREFLPNMPNEKALFLSSVTTTLALPTMDTPKMDTKSTTDITDTSSSPSSTN